MWALGNAMQPERCKIQGVLAGHPTNEVAGGMEKTAETARETGEFRCRNCAHVLPLVRGTMIPACPACGFDTFELLNPRFATTEQASNERARTRET
jgi:Zn finger protein HypA/HybF involved in hydrogenase expression